MKYFFLRLEQEKYFCFVLAGLTFTILKLWKAWFFLALLKQIPLRKKWLRHSIMPTLLLFSHHDIQTRCCCASQQNCNKSVLSMIPSYCFTQSLLRSFRLNCQKPINTKNSPNYYRTWGLLTVSKCFQRFLYPGHLDTPSHLDTWQKGT